MTEEEYKHLQSSVTVLDQMVKELKETYLETKSDINEKLQNIPIYYITISPERDKYMKEQIEFFNINNIQKLEGVVGKNIDDKFGQKYTFSNGKILNFKTEFSDYSKPELGCTLSHLDSIETIYNKGDELALIIEDDANFGLLQFSKPIKEVIKEAPKDWNVISLYIGGFKHKKKFTNKNEETSWGGVAYLINKTDKVDYLAADVSIFGYCGNSYVYCERPYFFTYNNNRKMESTIHPDHTHDHIMYSLYAIKYMKRLIS